MAADATGIHTLSSTMPHDGLIAPEACLREPLAVTVCICAHNEADVLADAVESAMAQRMSADQYEVLVVDSASEDGTGQLLCSLGAKWGARMRWVRADQPGLSQARNCGLAEADGAIVAYLDADAVADPGWLSAIVDAFAADRACGAAGGPVHVRWDHDQPTWWRRELDEALNFYNPGASAMGLTYPKYPYGTNLAVRTEAAAALGGFAGGLGRRGRALLAGEDGEMCYRLERAGWSVQFAPDAVVHHRTKADRLTRRFILKRAYQHGRSQRAIECMHGFESGLYPSLGKLIGMLIGRIAMLRCGLPFLKYWLFRVGYRLEGVKVVGAASDEPAEFRSPSPRPSASGRGGAAPARSGVGVTR